MHILNISFVFSKDTYCTFHYVLLFTSCKCCVLIYINHKLRHFRKSYAFYEMFTSRLLRVYLFYAVIHWHYHICVHFMWDANYLLHLWNVIKNSFSWGHSVVVHNTNRKCEDNTYMICTLNSMHIEYNIQPNSMLVIIQWC